MNATQCRMARAALDWSRDDLAKAANLAARTVHRLEDDLTVAPESSAAIVAAFEREGVVFIGTGVYAGGVVPPSKGS